VNAVDKLSSNLESVNFHLATQALKQFFYYELCDIYLVSNMLENEPRT